jgi:2-methylcitrate dehydratase PrpD
MDPQYEIAKHIASTTYKDLPPKAAEIAKMEILDSFAAALAGSSRDVVRMMIETFQEFGGKEQSSVIGRGMKLPVLDAAAINSVMMGALDFDAVVDFAPLHPSTLLIPVALAVSEYKGKVSGKELITAVALGADLLIRFAVAARYDSEVERTLAAAGGLALNMVAAVISGKILGFSDDEIASSMGLAYRQSANVPPTGSTFGGNLKGSTFPVRDGILAAFMVKKGIRTGDRDIVEGEHGLYDHFHHGRYDRETLMGGLGQRYLGVDITIKPYPSCRITHSFIAAALALANENDLRPDQIVEIKVIGNDIGYSLCTPVEEKSQPQTPVVSQFSPPWCVAAAIVRKKVTIGEFTEEAIKDPIILEVARKIKVENDPGVTGSLGAKVTVMTRGKAYTRHVEFPPGGPQNQLTFADCANKFRDCASYSSGPLTQAAVENIIKRVGKLEEVNDISEIIKELG